MKVSKNKYVTAMYDLHAGEGADRELMERATEEQPVRFICSYGMMLEGFERRLMGLEPGEAFEFTLTPEEAFGTRDEDNVLELSKEIFTVDGVFDSERVKEDASLPMMNAEGQHMMGTVKEVKDDVVVMDFNHPLAGETLHFAGKVIDVHDPTHEELAEIEQIMRGGCGGGCDCCGDHEHGHGECCGDHEHGHGECCGGNGCR